MIIRLCHSAGIVPICIVRRAEQAQMLKSDLGVKNVVNTSDPKEYPVGLAGPGAQAL